MRKYLVLVLAVMAMLVMVCLPGAAEEHKTVNLSNDHYYCSPGMERLGYYDDYASKIGFGLTQDDFDITYESASEYVTVLDDSGRVMISADAPMNNNLRLNIIYTPKVAGVGVKTTFVVVLRTSAPIETFGADVSRVCISNVRTASEDVTITGISDYDDQIVNISYDPAVMKLDTYTYYGRILNYTVYPAGVGTTELVFTAYNGWEVRIPVIVVAPPTQVAFGADSFTCQVGDTLDLGLDLGNGEYGVEACEPTVYMTRDGSSVSKKGFFPADANSFYAKEAGHYLVKVTAAYNVSNEVMIHVYEQGVCERIELSTGALYKDRDNIQVLCYDAEGGPLILPVSITAGADIAAINGRTISATGRGNVTVTVQNSDGTTTSRTFEVVVNPTEMTLNAQKLTLEIEDTFDLEVAFDQGAYPYTISYTASTSDFELKSIRVEGNRIIAQAPGTAMITVTAGPFTKYCNVTVPDGDKALHIELPPEPFGIGHTFQLSVQDKTGKVYPAVFSGNNNIAFDVTEDGLMTGKMAAYDYIQAALADGRVLRYYLLVQRVPDWISHPNVVVSLVRDSFSFDTVDSNIGPIQVSGEIDYTITDKNIATRGGYSSVTLYKAGVTTVTMWSKLNPEARCTFILEVVDKTVPLVGQMSMELPCGLQTQLPPLMDTAGNEHPVTWKITYDQPGEGNPASSGFVLEGDLISCFWPTASCILTGTTRDGATVKVFVKGYKLPEAIRIEPELLTLNVGEACDVSVLFNEPGAEIRQVYWIADAEGVVQLKEMTEGATNTFLGTAPGTTLVMAFLDNQAYALCMVTVLDPNHDPSVRLPGDANVDGLVNILDALLVLQHDVGWEVEINVSNADVDGDGAATIMDALKILQYDVGWEVELI